MEYNEQHNLMNKNRSRDRETSIRPSHLRGKVCVGDRGPGSTKGLVCMHIGLTNGHRQQVGEGMNGGGDGRVMWE